MFLIAVVVDLEVHDPVKTRLNSTVEIELQIRWIFASFCNKDE